MTEFHNSRSRQQQAGLQQQAGPGDELLWLAYRYSAGELTAAEATAFEDRLAFDQPAREALAQAVGLSATIYAIERSAPVTERVVVPAAAARRNWFDSLSTRSAGWFVAGAAACLALVMSWQAYRNGPIENGPIEVAHNEIVRPGQSPAITNPESVAKPELVDDETQLLLALLDGAEGLERAVPASSAASDFDLVFEEGAADEPSLDDQNLTPDWLLAAVAESKS